MRKIERKRIINPDIHDIRIAADDKPRAESNLFELCRGAKEEGHKPNSNGQHSNYNIISRIQNRNSLFNYLINDCKS